LDGIRGIAVLLVFFFHYGDLSQSSSRLLRFVGYVKGSGWIGVDIFFVLSGFLITGILYESRNESHYYRRFYIRRALRLFPVFYGVCLVVLLLAPLLHVQWRWAYLAVLFYGTNIVLPLHSSPDPVGPVRITHLWSLAVEEQFYLLWPFAVHLLKTREKVLRLSIGVIIVAFAARVVALYAGVPATVIYWELPTRMDSLAVGAALALLLRGPRKDFWESIARSSLVPLWLTVLLIGVYEHGLDHLNPVTIVAGYTLLAFASASLIAEALRPFSRVALIFNNSVLRFLGKISYGLYVYHLLIWTGAKPVFAFLQLRLRSQLAAGIGIYVVFLGGTVLFSYLSYRFYELRFLRLKDKLAPAPAKAQPAPEPQVASS
jgi:peptidoglycan/LPS O-acetylase OafA/YrhL